MAGLADAVLLLQAKNYSGSGDWLDESGNGHDAVITGATFTSDADGKYFAFNGSSDLMTIANHADLNFGTTDPLTAMAVCRTAQTGSQAYLLDKNQSGPGWALIYGGTYTSLIVDDGPNRVYDLTANLTINTIQTVAGVRNIVDDDVESFLDGVGTGSPTTDTTTATLSNANSLLLGRFSGFWWNGDIFAVAVWREALSDADVAAAGVALLAGASTITLLGA